MKFLDYKIQFVVAFIFLSANFVSYLRMPEYSSMDDGFVYFGWPFRIYAYGGYFGHPVNIWTGLIGNAFLALASIRVIRSAAKSLPITRRRSAAKTVTEFSPSPRSKIGAGVPPSRHY
jgi:hypothetical protein